MALTSQTTLDLVGQSSVLSFYQGVSLVDQITYSSNQITYASISSYNLSKSDMALYYNFLNTWLSSLYANFPIVAASAKLIWPLCQFDITESFAGVTHIIYNQTSTGTQVININYVPVAVPGAIAARGSPVTITDQEFIMGVNMKQNYFNQVALN
jgi:hypothetical protein